MTLAKIFERLREADTDDEVGSAWIAVDLLRRMYAAPDRDAAHRRLIAFYEWAVEVDIDEILRLPRTLDTSQDEVLAFFDTELRTQRPRPPTFESRTSAALPAGSATPTTTQLASASTRASPVGSRPPRDQVLQLRHRGLTHLSGEDPQNGEASRRGADSL